MAHPLNDKIDALRARVRWLVLVYGLSAVIAAVLGAVIVLGLGDYLVRFQDRGIRVIASLLALGLLAWTTYRYLYLPMTTRLGDAALALRIQERLPQLDDRLVSAVEFLRQSEDDPTAGSAALRRAVIAQATSESERLDFAGTLDRRPSLRAAVLASGVVLLATILIAIDPATSQTALARLTNPLGDTAWPQCTHLELREVVTRVARGQAFEVEAVDAEGEPLPPEVRISYRFEGPGGAKTIEVERMQLLGGAMTARRENITRPFEYKVEGGDDHDMDWIAVEVTEPPGMQSLAVTLVPPAYTGWPTEHLPNGGNIRALAGSELRFSGVVTRPIRSASLCLEGGTQVPAAVSEDGLRFVIGPPARPPGEGGGEGNSRGSVRSGRVAAPVAAPGASGGYVVEKSVAYWFKLTDREGLASDTDSRWEIHALSDPPPGVVIEQPTSNLFVTPQAVVPLQITAKDDLALRQVLLVFTRSDLPDQKEASVSLYAGPEQMPRQGTSGLGGATEQGDRRTIAHRWELAPLKLVPGTQITYFASAADYRPQTGKSESRKLSVITPEELQERVASRQNLILTELARVLKMQRDSRSQVQALEIRVREIGALGQPDVDHLQGAELGQRQVGRSLTSRSEGVAMHILALLADLENNRVDSPDIQRRMQALLDEIGRLERDHLPPIGRELTAAIKSAQVGLQEQAKSSAPDPATAASLAMAGQHQDQVITSLEAALAQLKRWDDYRRFHRDVAQLLRDQEELARGSAELGRRTLTKELKDLAPQELADLKVLVGRQLELARRLDHVEQDMEQAGRDLRASDPLAADTVSDAVAESRRLGIGAAMRSAAGQLAENRMGQVGAGHTQIAQDIQEVLDILANRRQSELARLERKLKEAESDLKGLQEQQADLRREFERSAKDPDAVRRKAEFDRLRQRQQALEEEVERMARRLERLMAEQPGKTMREAADRMKEAGAAGEKAGSAQSAKKAADAEEKLKQALDQLKQRRRQVQAELAMEQLARLEDALKHLRNQQENVLKETKHYASLEAAGPLTRAQTASLRDVARLQQSLQADTARAAEQMAGAGGFHLALSAAQGEMGRAAALLDRRQTGPATQQAEKNALAKLDLVLKALEPEPPDSKDGGPSGGGDNAGGKQRPTGGVATLAELKLLRLMQVDLTARTEDLQKAVAGVKEPTEEQRRQCAMLSEEQGRLADLTLQLLRPAQQDPQDQGEPPHEKPKEDVP
jgi:hypothetical protein